MSHGGKSFVVFILGLVLSAPGSAQVTQRGGFGPVVPPQLNAANGARNPAMPGLPNMGGRLNNNSNIPGGIGYSPSPIVPSVPDPGPLPSFIPPYSFYIPGPGDFYRGVGDLTLAYGRYAQDYQRARLLNQDVERAKIDTRRRLYDEWRYYQSLQPTAEDIRIARIEQDLGRARRQAPISEIVAGKSLNDLLSFLKTAAGKQQYGLELRLDEDMLKRINVTPRDGVSAALIRTGKVAWPLVLRDERFADVREKLDTAVQTAVDRAKLNKGGVEPGVLNELDKLRADMDNLLDKTAPTLNMSQFMEGKRYMNWLSEGIRALGSPDAGNFFSVNPRYQAQGTTVRALIAYMNEEGLRFASALPGDEGPYRNLYNMLVAYDNSIQNSGR